MFQDYTLNVRGRLMEITEPQVMGILNVTPDSFYAASRMQTEEAIAARTREIRDEGATWIDVGAYSTRPGAEEVSEEEEISRLRRALRVVRREVGDEMPISVDTFRADVAKMCSEEFGIGMVNDISGGTIDRRMFSTAASLHLPYVLTHIQGTPADMQLAPHYDDLLRDVFVWFSERLQMLYDAGCADVIADPGFGFGKTLEQNYHLLAHLSDFAELDCPLLVGVSRKSMVYRLLGATPAEALNGTTALHTIALQQGAHILRVHDVRAAREVITIVNHVMDTDDTEETDKH